MLHTDQDKLSDIKADMSLLLNADTMSLLSDAYIVQHTRQDRIYYRQKQNTLLLSIYTSCITDPNLLVTTLPST